MKKKIQIISALLALLMSSSVLFSCNAPEEMSTEKVTEQSTASFTETEEKKDAVTEAESETENSPKLSGEHAILIENAERLANGVQSYYSKSDRSAYTIENLNMSLDYSLDADEEQMVTAIRNSKGVPYVQNTMDAFVRMKNGNTYYASATDEQTRVNIYRYGYYYYDIHMLEQDFENGGYVIKEAEVPITDFVNFMDTTRPTFNDGELKVMLTGSTDPQVYANTDLDTASYNNLQFKVKSDTVVKLDVYIIAGTEQHHNERQKQVVELVNDGEWHTVNIPLNSDTFPDYTDKLTSIRFDLGGIVGTDFHLKDVNVQKVKSDSIPLSLDRTFHTFPDKLHQELHVVAYEYTDSIDAIGMITEISADTVVKLIVKDKKGLHESINGVDWASAEYVGFDIKNAGIFGYILPYDNESGTITVTLENNVYIITQTHCPEGGIIKPPVDSTLNDFKMGHRLYTDENHDFEAFLNEAYCERNPLDKENFVIDDAKMKRGAKYKEYNALRGVYQFSIKGANGFNDPYYNNQNLYYNASFSITGDDRDRSIYIMAYSPAGCLECAALLDENNLMLPIKLEVSKNFSEKEEPFYNCGDQTYGETFFPAMIEAGERYYYTILNLYQNWGDYPLKQLSSIGYYMPYYHLSTGVTETNCLAGWYCRGKNLYTLPDHRSMSMPASSDLKNRYSSYGNQPQRPNAGYHYFLQYTDAEGNYSASEYLDNIIDCAGPTYADVTLNYLSDDGKIKVSYRHMEMPQVDENRTYYEIKYEVLDTVKIANFREDFSFYTTAGYRNYSKIGYLNENNEHTVVSPNTKDKPLARILGDDHPYFALYYQPKYTEYTNLSFMVYDSEFIIGGKKIDSNFVVIDQYNALRLSLNIDGEVTLQKGDTFYINAIIMPWGGSWVLDDGTTYHNTTCENVIRVRENSILNPIRLEAVENCEILDSPFLPLAQTTNGHSATFTVTGGCDYDLPTVIDEINMTVRVNGFASLGKLKIEEFINGAWVTVDISSADSPDSSGNSHSFDGYAVHYDGNGTYGYSFVTTITDGAPRTFRATVE